MLKYKWTSLDIDNEFSFRVFNKTFSNLGEPKKNIITLDTETTGLHIINDKPFLIQFGYVDFTRLDGYTFAIEVNSIYFNRVMMKLIGWCRWNKATIIGHNLKFDLHMLANIGQDITQYEELKFTDTAFYIRYAHDSLHISEGGPPMKLKEYATKYIDHTAKLHEQLLKKERSDIAKIYNFQLKRALGITMKDMAKYFGDTIYEVSDLPEQYQIPYLAWRASLPAYLQLKVQTVVEADMIRYSDLDRMNLIKYAHLDIVYTFEVYFSLAHVIEGRHQEIAIELENNLIVPLFNMERTGFLADKEYLEKSRVKLKTYIIKRREELYVVAGQYLKVSQNELIKDLLNDKFEVECKSTSEEELNLLKLNLFKDDPAVDFINRVQELRTLEKWYSAYILRFQKDLKTGDRLYTTINQVGAVSGRVTSDFQQFPKKAISTVDSKELFKPRKIVKAPYAIGYLDYSQIELRIQALYTMLLGKPDLNMCRAYMPFDCTERNGVFYLNESPETEWHPVDVHSETTKAATGLDESHPDFQKLRTDIGKKVNFSKNYGAQLNRIREMFPEKSLEECVKIDKSYYTAFPGIREYHKYCKERANGFSNTQSLFGVRYYNVSGHKLKNLLIQGSAAHLLKFKIIDIYNLIKNEGKHIKMQMQIHDELSFEIYTEQGFQFIPLIKAIMEDWPESKIPIIAEYEVTKTNWAEKGKPKL